MGQRPQAAAQLQAVDVHRRTVGGPLAAKSCRARDIRRVVSLSPPAADRCRVGNVRRRRPVGHRRGGGGASACSRFGVGPLSEEGLTSTAAMRQGQATLLRRGGGRDGFCRNAPEPVAGGGECGRCAPSAAVASWKASRECSAWRRWWRGAPAAPRRRRGWGRQPFCRRGRRRRSACPWQPLDGRGRWCRRRRVGGCGVRPPWGIAQKYNTGWCPCGHHCCHPTSPSGIWDRPGFLRFSENSPTPSLLRNSAAST